ncbi:MAG: hypothetical protein LH474_12700 [Chamaesiphon sp.]|nr:hypothetical protein [Chamaesiphon sp.]
MISSAEFQQTLQAGKIHQALALLVRDATELDITTRLTEDPITDDRAGNTGYLRTKINLLTGSIQNEVSKDLLANGNNYLKLQQLHHDRIIASDRIVQGYFSQLKAILAALPPTLEQLPQVESSQLNSDALLARLTQAALLLQDPVVSSPDSHLANNLANINNDDLDLSIDPDGAVWEEWVEDEDFSTELTIGRSDSAPSIKSDWEENWVQRHLNSVEIKSPNPRTRNELTPVSAGWDKFAPECINIDTPPQPRSPK